MDFNDIIGQKQVTTSLMCSLESHRIGHANAFVGPKGIGKRTVARIFAATVLCQNTKDGKSCLKCKSCKLFISRSNPDFIEIEPEGTSIGVDTIREMQRDIAIKPMYSGHKVYLISDADRMTVQAQNSLLKTLEEPPDYAVLILTTSKFETLLETIRSRVLRYDFKRNTLNEIYTYLESKFTDNLQGIDFIASYSNGIIGTALELANSGKLMELREETLQVLLNLSKPKLIDIFKLFKFFETNKEQINIILDIMILFYRDMIIVKNMEDDKLLINSDKKDIILSTALDYTSQKLVNCIEIIEEARSSMKNNVNFQLLIEIMLMRLQEECAQW
jgi:DNA polymerase-3 subunit delta'